MIKIKTPFGEPEAAGEDDVGPLRLRGQHRNNLLSTGMITVDHTLHFLGANAGGNMDIQCAYFIGSQCAERGFVNQFFGIK